MNTSTLLKTLAVATLTLFSQAAAFAQAQVRQVASFQQVKASGAINVFIKQGPATEVRVEAAPEVASRIRTEVQGNTLAIYREKGYSLNLFNKEQVNVYVTCPRLSGIEVSGASDVKGQSPITADEFSIRASGASDVTLTLNAQSLSATASGASDIRLSGTVGQQRVQVSGSSDYRAYELRSRTANVQASGSSDAYVYVEGELQASSSGASDIYNKGKARTRR